MAQENLRNQYVGPDNAAKLEQAPEWLLQALSERIMVLARLDGQLEIRGDFHTQLPALRAWLTQRNLTSVRGRFSELGY
jgi:hypothetical protein